eukprot:gene13998-biopygen6990
MSFPRGNGRHDPGRVIDLQLPHGGCRLMQAKNAMGDSGGVLMGNWQQHRADEERCKKLEATSAHIWHPLHLLRFLRHPPPSCARLPHDADLRGALLEGCNLVGCDVAAARLDASARLRGASLGPGAAGVEWQACGGADLRGADLAGCRFHGDLAGWRLDGALLRRQGSTVGEAGMPIVAPGEGLHGNDGGVTPGPPEGTGDPTGP